MEKGAYTFLVDGHTNKDQIAKVVEQQFGVKVTKVNVAGVTAKQKRIAMTKKFTRVGGGKKAIVYLEAGQSIPQLSPKKESPKAKNQGKTKKESSQKGKEE